MKTAKNLNQKLAILLMLQVVLCLGFWWPKDSKSMVHPNPLAAVDFSNVTTLSIVEKGEHPKTLSLEKQSGVWVVPDQQNFPADEKLVESAFNKLKSLALSHPVAQQVSSHKKLQVGEDDFQRKVVFASGEKSNEVGFYLGSSPQFKQIHVRALGNDEVFATDKISTFDFPVESKDWVEKSLINVSSEMIQTIEIKRAREVLHFSKATAKDDKTPEAWEFNGKPVKAGSLDAILRNLSDFRLTQVMGEHEKPEYGLKNPMVTVKVNYLDKEKKEHEKVFVIAKQKDGDFIARVSGMEYLVGIAPYQVNPLIDTKVKDVLKGE